VLERKSIVADWAKRFMDHLCTRERVDEGEAAKKLASFTNQAMRSLFAGTSETEPAPAQDKFDVAQPPLPFPSGDQI
jgi:hypothetical protein